MVGPEPRPKATVHSFFPIQTFEAPIQMLPLIRISEQQKQTKSTYWPGQNTPSDCRCAVFFLLVLGRNKSANKGSVMSIKRFAEGTAASWSFTPEFISLAGFHGRDMLNLLHSCCSTTRTRGPYLPTEISHYCRRKLVTGRSF